MKKPKRTEPARKRVQTHKRRRKTAKSALPGYKGYVSKKAYDEAHQPGYGL